MKEGERWILQGTVLKRDEKVGEGVFRSWLERFLEELQPLERAFAHAYWGVSTSGRKEDADRLEHAERAYRGLFASAERYRYLKSLADDAKVEDSLLARQLDLLLREFEGNQMNDYTLRKLVALKVEIENLYNNFRADLGGEKVGQNRLREILRTSADSKQVQAAWEAAKQIGPVVAPRVQDLVRVRNDLARARGYADFQQMSLRLDEIDRDWLFKILDDLAETTEAPFRALKAEIDAELARRFGIPAAELRPWHYGDPFFQGAPPIGDVDLDDFYRAQDLTALTVRFYDGLGMDIREIIDRSDLFEREGKCQHAFCTDLDRRGDVRVLCNLKADEYWMGTMLHEFGHAVYDREYDAAMPHVLRGPAHTCATEAIAMMFGRASKDRRFLSEVAGIDPEKARVAAAAARKELRTEQLIFMRWAQVVVRFENELYSRPDQDLNKLWWDLVEKYQGLRRPDDRDAPDWATKVHIATAPVYYQNYILGELTASQLQRFLLDQVGGNGEGVGGLLGRPEVGEILRERVFRPGRRYHWNEMLERATGSRLDPQHFMREMTEGLR